MDKPRMKGRHLVMMSLGSAIGTGLFVGSGKGVASAGPATLVAYIVAGLLVIAIMYMLGEMVAAHPDSGAFSVYTSRAMGSAAGFAMGWVWWIELVVVVAAEAIAAAIIRPLSFLGFLFGPLVRFLSGATTRIVKILGFSRAPNPDVTEDEVKILIAQGAESGIFENSEREMVEGILNLDDRRVSSFMTPRTDVVAIDMEDGKDAARGEIIAHADLACLPVIEGDLDRIVGMLDVREALAALVRDGNLDIKALLKTPVLIPETISALRALSILRDRSASTGLIVDEYGGVSGLVTMSDLMESVVSGLAQGDSDDMPGLTEREDGSWLVDGNLAIAEFADSMRLDDDEFAAKTYDTVAGLVLDCMGSIPKAGERCEWNGFSIEIMDMDGNRIDKVLVTRLEEPEEPALED